MNSLPIAIIVFFLLIVFLWFCFYYSLCISWVSSYILAYIISFVILFVLYPVNQITGEENEIGLNVYTFITFFLIFSIIVYVLFMSITDCRKNCIGCKWLKICRNGNCDTGNCDTGNCEGGVCSI